MFQASFVNTAETSVVVTSEPSKDELRQMFVHIKVMDRIDDCRYWSSTEGYKIDLAWYEDVKYQSYNYKANNHHCMRPVRSF